MNDLQEAVGNVELADVTNPDDHVADKNFKASVEYVGPQTNPLDNISPNTNVSIYLQVNNHLEHSIVADI